MQSLNSAAWAGAWQVETRSPRGTHKLARALASHLSPGAVIALVGELGCGKTSFVQGLAAGWQVHNLQDVLSPTYTLVNEYSADQGTLIHMDLYRLQDAESARALGMDEQLLRTDCLVAVEWADHLPEIIPPHAVWIRLSRSGPRARLCDVMGMPEPGDLR